MNQKPNNTNSSLPPIIHTGKGWLAVDKPSGMSVHNDPGHDLCSVADHYIKNDKNFLKNLNPTSGFQVNAVHRLDKMTSGLIILALNQEIFRYFTNLFSTHQIRKRYVALVHGQLNPEASPAVWHTWSYPLAISSGGRKDPIGRGRKQKSTTRYRIMSRSLHYTMIECDLITGRKHQIRRHAKKAGHPVVGDRRYGPLRAADFIKIEHHFDRLGLHSASIKFIPPGSKQPLELKTPEFPHSMRELIKKDTGETPDDFSS